ncbi:MAG TPA: DNA translocase FtsK [Blastocatellia bacterium]|nr:DNA translocase FtsK [Blastocatellia bacterium]
MAEVVSINLRDALLNLQTGLLELRTLIASQVDDAEIPRPPRRPASRATHRPNPLAKRDELYTEALKIVTEFGHASVSVLQLWLSIGEGRAAKILREMEEDELIAPLRRKFGHKVLERAYSLRESAEAGAAANQQKSCL